MLKSYEILDHGYCNSQYFQGCGVSHTRFTHCFTGCGMNAKEAYEDAVEQAYCGSDIREALDKLPRRPRGIRARDKVPADCRGEDSDVYWYVSIRLEVA